MISDELGKILYDKSTRGVQLSEEEAEQLQAWYDYQDKLEDELINRSSNTISLADLKAQVELSLEKLSTLANQIKKISQENEIIKSENRILRKKIACSS